MNTRPATAPILLLLLLALILPSTSPAQSPGNARTPATDADLRYWLQNMAVHHQFTVDEMTQATGMEKDAIVRALARFDIQTGLSVAPPGDGPLRVLPYPGGRHPRIGFLDGAIDPQRETKVSIFTPWSATSYVVLDVPEALWSNLGLTYLAHTHIDTVWTKRNITLEPLEWERRPDRTFRLERKLPNGIVIGTHVKPAAGHVRMDMWLINGSNETLTDLRVQNCVMLKGAPEFNQLTNANKVVRAPYVACRNENGTRWVITAWEPCHRPWSNPPVPCLHSDPKFPDCPPGETRTLKGWLSFYEGTHIQAEFDRIDTIF